MSSLPPGKTCYFVTGNLSGGGLFNSAGCRLWINGVERDPSEPFPFTAGIGIDIGYVFLEVSDCALSYARFGFW